MESSGPWEQASNSSEKYHLYRSVFATDHEIFISDKSQLAVDRFHRYMPFLFGAMFERLDSVL